MPRKVLRACETSGRKKSNSGLPSKRNSKQVDGKNIKNKQAK